MTKRKDIFPRVTDQIVKAIEEGAGSYRMPWRTSGGFPSLPINAASKRRTGDKRPCALGHRSGERLQLWHVGYQQWQELGAQVRKGEKSANVVFWKFFDHEDEQQDNNAKLETHLRKIPMARDHWLFNAE